MTDTILIASQNAHKIDEIRPLLERAGYKVTDAREHELTEPDETGRTCLENARIKAQSALKETGMAVLADDSGFMVDALGDFPGVDSKPYAESCGGYQGAIDDLFRRLNGRSPQAHCLCILVLLFPDGREVVAQGRIDVEMRAEPKGDSGFGFDQWIYYPKMAKTFAEMTLDEKNSISHRSRALDDLLNRLAG